MGQSQPTEEGSGPCLDPSKSYKQYNIQFNKMEYINISKQILKGRRQLIKRKMEGRGVFVNVKKRKEEKEENYQEYCQRREQEEKVRKEKEKLKKEKEKIQPAEDPEEEETYQPSTAQLFYDISESGQLPFATENNMSLYLLCAS